MSWRNRSRRLNESLQIVSQEELMNRVIRAKAQLALCGKTSVTVETEEGEFEITPALAKKLLRAK